MYSERCTKKGIFSGSIRGMHLERCTQRDVLREMYSVGCTQRDVLRRVYSVEVLEGCT